MPEQHFCAIRNRLAVLIFFGVISCTTPQPDPIKPIYVDKTQNVLRAYADKQWPDIAGCYDVYAKAHQGAIGELQFIHVINEDGTIAGREISSNTLPDAESLVDCSLDKMKKWEYPRTGAKQRLIIRYQFPPQA